MADLEGMFVRRHGAGRTVVYIHGLGESGRCFEALVRQPGLAGLHHVIPDLPGYGRSPRPAVVGDLIELADHLAAWLRAEAATAVDSGPAARPIVVGHSMGGVVGVLLVERHPDVAGALIDVEGNVSPGDCTFSAGIAAQSLAGFVERGLGELRDQVERDGRTDAALRGYHASLQLADPRSVHRHAGELVAISADETMAARVAALPVPTTYVAGVPGGACARSLALLDAAGVRVARIAPAGHWPFVDQPALVAAEIARVAAT